MIKDGEDEAMKIKETKYMDEHKRKRKQGTRPPIYIQYIPCWLLIMYQYVKLKRSFSHLHTNSRSEIILKKKEGRDIHTFCWEIRPSLRVIPKILMSFFICRKSRLTLWILCWQLKLCTNIDIPNDIIKVSINVQIYSFSTFYWQICNDAQFTYNRRYLSDMIQITLKRYNLQRNSNGNYHLVSINCNVTNKLNVIKVISRYNNAG